MATGASTNGSTVEHSKSLQEQESHSSSSDDEDEETRCGLGPCRGSFLQRLANKKVYILVYSFLGFFQAMFFSYSIATLTTVEKQFKLKSQTTGILLSGNECSQILLSVIMTYFGGSGHRPRLVSLGVLFSGISSLLIVIPHFVYGESTPVTNSSRIRDVCDVNDVLEDEICEDYDQPIGPMIYIFMSQFISGIGTTLFSTLGITYLDDNVKRKQSPMIIGLMSALRMIGPVLGYVLAGACIRRHVNLSEETTLKPSDPAWIGAWWLGFLVIGIAQISTFWILALFPRTLPSSKRVKSAAKTLQKAIPSQRTLKEFPAALKRLLTNKILIYNNLSAIFYVFAFSGYITFLPKYLETQFQQSAAMAGLVNGTIGIAFMCVGFLLSGFLISKYRPRAWILALYDVITGVIFFIGLLIFAFISCTAKPMHGVYEIDGQLEIQINAPCNKGCQCLRDHFAPACSQDGNVNFFSACHAGCRSVNSTDGRTVFTDCSCIDGANDFNTALLSGSAGFPSPGLATSGYCQSDCSKIFFLYVFVMAVMKLLSSAGRVSSIIIGFRCVEPIDKSFAIGLGTMVISLFAFIPSPIIYGIIIDKACILWRMKCGSPGNCWLYEPTLLRRYLHFTTAGFIAFGVFFEIFACFAVRKLDLYKEPDEVSSNGTHSGEKSPKEMEMMISSKS